MPEILIYIFLKPLVTIDKWGFLNGETILQNHKVSD